MKKLSAYIYLSVVALKAPLRGLAVPCLMILAIPAVLMALLATAILAMRLAGPPPKNGGGRDYPPPRNGGGELVSGYRRP